MMKKGEYQDTEVKTGEEAEKDGESGDIDHIVNFSFH